MSSLALKLDLDLELRSLSTSDLPLCSLPLCHCIYIRVQGKANASLKTNCTGRSNLARFQKLVGRGTWLDPTLIKVWLLEQTNTIPFSFESKLIQLFSSCPWQIIIWFYQNAEFFESLRRAACILRSVP